MPPDIASDGAFYLGTLRQFIEEAIEVAGRQENYKEIQKELQDTIEEAQRLDAYKAEKMKGANKSELKSALKARTGSKTRRRRKVGEEEDDAEGREEAQVVEDESLMAEISLIRKKKKELESKRNAARDPRGHCLNFLEIPLVHSTLPL